MIKVAFAEIKKILSRPGIYILSILLAVILILGIFIYNPTVYESKSYNLGGSSYIDNYSAFISSSGKKQEADKALLNAIGNINAYSTYDASLGTLNYKEAVNALIDRFEEQYVNYRNSYNDATADNSSIRTRFNQSISNLDAKIQKGVQEGEFGSYPIVTTKDNFSTYNKTLNELKEVAAVVVDQNGSMDAINQHFAKLNSLKQRFLACINQFKFPTLSAKFIDDYTSNTTNTKYAELNNRLKLINDDITKHYQEAIADNNVNLQTTKLMNDLANKYINTVDTYVNLIKYELICNAFDMVKTNQQLSTLYLKDISSYNSNSMLIKYSYLFDHNQDVTQYANPLTIGTASSNKINAYDYAYFILKLFSFVIIIFAVITACNAIAGEIKDGSMRYFAIRPVSRTNIYFGKFLAILMLSIILILFSFIISLCVGGAFYSFETLNVLTIFNSSVAVTMHPIVMILVYLMSFVFELSIYLSIAMLVSSLIKSDLLAVTIVLVLYLINILLPLFIQGANTILAFYPFSHISLYALFGSSIYAPTNDFFNLLLGAKVYAGTNMFLTIIIIAALLVIPNIIANKLFKKKEF